MDRPNGKPWVVGSNKGTTEWPRLCLYTFLSEEKRVERT
jgi:hypothetical protein